MVPPRDFAFDLQPYYIPLTFQPMWKAFQRVNVRVWHSSLRMDKQEFTIIIIVIGRAEGIKWFAIFPTCYYMDRATHLLLFLSPIVCFGSYTWVASTFLSNRMNKRHKCERNLLSSSIQTIFLVIFPSLSLDEIPFFYSLIVLCCCYCPVPYGFVIAPRYTFNVNHIAIMDHIESSLLNKIDTKRSIEIVFSCIHRFSSP